MKHCQTENGFRPFKNLKSLITKKSAPQPPLPTRNSPPENAHSSQMIEREITFQAAVADVTPMVNNKVCPKKKPSDKRRNKMHQIRDLSMEQMVKENIQLVIPNLPEYMSGTGYNVDPKSIQRLQRRDFSIQDHLDLHGLTREEAKDAFDTFLSVAINSSKRMLLIIHGRGLSSPSKPVLKEKVSIWLTSGPWRRWILAFSSARPEDGGTGATYVLLRKNPATKKSRKGKKIHFQREF